MQISDGFLLGIGFCLALMAMGGVLFFVFLGLFMIQEIIVKMKRKKGLGYRA